MLKALVVPGRATLPQPAKKANSRGPKSRAGLIAYPALGPYDMPIAPTAAPTSQGPMLPAGARLRPSVIASTRMSRNAVPTIWSTSGPTTLPWK